MDIKRMHEMIEKLSEAAECEFSKGIENVDTCEMDKVVDMIKDLSEAMYYRTLTKAMQESDTEDIMEMFDRYGDDGKRYYDMWRYKSGRFAPKGRGTKRGYEPVYNMTPEMYRMYSPEYYRDMDRMDGKLYYTSNSSSGNMSSQGVSRGYSDGRDSREGRNGQSRKSYMEAKEMHKGNTPEDKEAKRKELDKWMTDIGSDIKELVHDMSAEEKTTAKQKLTNLANSLV